ncbi:hypothetical protein CALCODRAFT_483078 [Calocera cornea HHB12733]|uniref:Prolyl 4-hydroxylase alpha subunit Fe(2+) 2OG dioxygenase domain-containing protein n=1 Tax=Calocera cornea HHB12733 TaxID=1353952 RepID=A0A165G240_9BASI|nr:hypothetical protein CALCODRAFT_483078 [Calocera cornea HHB12733]
MGFDNHNKVSVTGPVDLFRPGGPIHPIRVAKLLDETLGSVRELKTAPVDGNILLYQQIGDEQEVLAVRFSDVYSASQAAEITAAYDDLIAAKPNFYTSSAQKRNRSSTPAFYAGFWQRFTSKPFLSRAADKQSPEILAKLDHLLLLLDKYVAQKTLGILKQHYPALWQKQKDTLEWLHQQPKIAKLLEARPALRNSLWACLAVKMGGSERLHIDSSDPAELMTAIFAMGDFEGGELELPTTGYRIPVQPGQVLFAKTRILPHNTAPILSGTRYAFTGFTDSIIVDQAKGL